MMKRPKMPPKQEKKVAEQLRTESKYRANRMLKADNPKRGGQATPPPKMKPRR